MNKFDIQLTPEDHAALMGDHDAIVLMMEEDYLANAPPMDPLP